MVSVDEAVLRRKNATRALDMNGGKNNFILFEPVSVSNLDVLAFRAA